MELDEPAATAQDARGIAVCVPFYAARLPVVDAEVTVDPAELESQRVDRRVRSRAEIDGVARGRFVEFRACWKTLVAQARDEHLGQDDPVARLGDGHAASD